jgi:hypothetical protein
MSIHILNVVVGSQLLQVQIGWDSPMQWFYLVVSPIDSEGYLDDPIYSNLDEVDPKSNTLEYYISVCDQLNLVLPDEMIAGVKEDRKSGVMGRTINYSER